MMRFTRATGKMLEDGIYKPTLEIVSSILDANDNGTLPKEFSYLIPTESGDIDISNMIIRLMIAYQSDDIHKELAKHISAERLLKLGEVKQLNRIEPWDNTKEYHNDEEWFEWASGHSKYWSLGWIMANTEQKDIFKYILSEIITLATLRLEPMDDEFPATITGLDCAIVYYWAVKNNMLGLNRGALKSKKSATAHAAYNGAAGAKFSSARVDESDSLEQFIRKLSGIESVQNTMLDYVHNLAKDAGRNTPDLALVDNMCKAVREQAGASNVLSTVLKGLQGYLEDSGELSPLIKEVLGDQAAEITLVCGDELHIGDMMANRAAIVMYLYVKIRSSDANKYEIALCRYASYILRLDLHEKAEKQMLMTSIEVYKGELKRLMPLKSEVRVKTEKLDKIKALLTEAKQTKKDDDKLIGELSKTVERQDREIQGRLAQRLSASDIANLQERLAEQDKIIAKQATHEAELKRKLDKRDKENDELRDKSNSLTKQVEITSTQYEAQKVLSDEMLVNKAYNEVPIECFVAALRNTKITLIGGDLMHTRLQNYGMDNIRMYKAGSRDSVYRGIDGADIVVIVTAFVDHCTSDLAMDLCRTNNKQVLRFNNKSPELLIYALFQQLYKQ